MPFALRAAPAERQRPVELVAPAVRVVARHRHVGDEGQEHVEGGADQVGGNGDQIPHQRRLEVGPHEAVVGIGDHPIVFGVGVGVVVFALSYKKVEYERVDFTCNPWEAPIGGDDCEKCHSIIVGMADVRSNPSA